MLEKNKSGFTIIEIVLVLAIAGLIFLMVFVAFPALQRNQRDAQRRQDMLDVVAAVEKYKVNSGGDLPSGKSSSSCPSPSGGGEHSTINSGVIVPNNPDSYTFVGQVVEACRFIATYLNSSSSIENEFVDPDGIFYGFEIKRSGIKKKPTGGRYNVYLYKGVTCSGEGEENMNEGQDGNYAVYYKLESGEFCKDNT